MNTNIANLFGLYVCPIQHVAWNSVKAHIVNVYIHICVCVILFLCK
jgi:hypothetical protein